MKTTDDVFSWYVMGLGGVLGALLQMSSEGLVCPEHWYIQLRKMQAQMDEIVKRQTALRESKPTE